MNKSNFLKAENLRHEFHKHPELSCEEVWTKGHIIEFLRNNTSLEVVDCGEFLYAVYRASDVENSAIAFRADFDALPIEDEIDKPYRSEIPGVGHKCGHDGHTASLCGLALELEELKPERDVYLIFQHAEETGGGARVCRQVLLDHPEISEIYGYHNMPGLKEGTIYVAKDVSNCASKGMSVFLKGTPTHASQPELGKNPAFAFADIIKAIPELIRPEGHKGLLLCTIVQVDIGDCAFGVSASDGVLRMTIRAEYENEMNELQSAIETLAGKLACEGGFEVRFEYQDEFPETRNEAKAVEKVLNACSRLGYETFVADKPIRGSEDFGEYLKVVPGAFMFVGAGEDAPAFHTSAFDFNDRLIEYTVEMSKALI